MKQIFGLTGADFPAVVALGGLAEKPLTLADFPQIAMNYMGIVRVWFEASNSMTIKTPGTDVSGAYFSCVLW